MSAREPKDFSQEPLWAKYRGPSEDFIRGGRNDLPPPPSDLVDWLRATYPPRCRLPEETEREHERYAGAVDLALLIIKRMEAEDTDPSHFQKINSMEIA